MLRISFILFFYVAFDVVSYVIIYVVICVIISYSHVQLHMFAFIHQRKFHLRK